MASLIIGVSGRKRSGKDTFASRLVDAHGFTRIAFADPLKAVALRINPLIQVDTDEAGHVFGAGAVLIRPAQFRLAAIVADAGWEAAKSVREVRRLLQNLGVAMREEVHMDVWVEAALERAERIDGPVVITDVRFPNEMQGIFNAGGTVVRIERPGLPTDDLHVSETAMDGYQVPYTVVNDGTVADLHAAADDFLRNPEIAWPLAAYR
jgi:hypothetical protein